MEGLDTLKQVQSPGWQPNAKDLRADGSQKGTGFLGPLKRKDGGVSTELTIGVNLGGKETNIPTLVPTLTEQEKQYLLNTDPLKLDWQSSVGKGIMQKAVDHANQRVASGRSVFADQQDQSNAARIAERNRVDAFYETGRQQQLDYEKSQQKPLTPLQLAEQKAAVRRQSLLDQYAPYGLQALLRVLSGQPAQQPQPQQQPPRR